MGKGRFEAAKPPKSGKKIGINIVIGILVTIIVVCLALGLYIFKKLQQLDPKNISTEAHAAFTVPGVDDGLAQTETTVPPTETEPKPTDPDYGTLGKVVNFLVIGQDARPGEDSKIADTMILVTVNKETKQMTMTSFLRDTKVSVPDGYRDIKGNYHSGSSKMNLWFALGYSWGGDLSGMDVLDAIIKENFGPEVDFNIEIDFDAFDGIINAVGGVEVELDADEVAYLEEEFAKYPDLGYVFNEGLCKLDGWSAEVYARMRHATYADNDYNRTGRQRKVIGALVEKAKKLDPIQINNLIDTFLPMIITDMEMGDIANCVLELLPLLPDLTMESIQAPNKEMEMQGTLEDLFHDGMEHSVIYFNHNKAKEILIPITECD